jgi:hypothetical protein
LLFIVIPLHFIVILSLFIVILSLFIVILLLFIVILGLDPRITDSTHHVRSSRLSTTGRLDRCSDQARA